MDQQPPQYPPSGPPPFPNQWPGPPPTYYQPMMPPPPPPPSPKKPNGWLIGIIIGAVVLIAVCSGIGYFVVQAANQTASTLSHIATITVSDSNTTQATSQATLQATPQGPSSQHHQVGETIVADATWTVTVHSVKTSQGSEFEKPDAGKIYLLIDVTVKNTSSQSQPVSSLLQFTLRDATGQEINESIATFAPNAPNGNVEAGGQIRGTLVYQVPTGANTYTLAFDPSITSSNSVIWDIHMP